MSEWKAGGKAMVDLVQGPGDAHTFHIPSSGGPYFLVSASALQPAADPHLALKTAVVEAVTAYQKDRKDRTLYTKMREAVGALEAALAPPKSDPVMTLFETVMTEASNGQDICDDIFHPVHRTCLQNHPDCKCRAAITKGLAAVEAARGAE